MQDEYISRKALTKALETDFNTDWDDYASKNNFDKDYINGVRDEYDDVLKIISQQPTFHQQQSVDVQSVKRGYWKPIMMSEATDWDLSLTGGRDEICEYNCSMCGKPNIRDEFGEDFLPPFCPHCGADMRGDTNG